jgi:DedD protein
LEQAVKQRLAGAAVLAALAIITLPLIFDTERAPGVQVPEAVPPQPVYPAVVVEEPRPVAPPPDRPAGESALVSDMYPLNNDAPPSAADTVPVAPPPAAPTPAPAKPAVTNPAAAQTQTAAALPPLPAAPVAKLDASGVPESWVVQVAAMSDRSKADALVARLKLNGYAAFTHVTRDSAGEVSRVFVGPKLERAQAVKIKQKIDREMSLQTMVKPFSPR